MERKRLVAWPEYLVVAGIRLVGYALLEGVCILGTVGVAMSMLAMFVTFVLVCLLAASFDSEFCMPMLLGASVLFLVVLAMGGLCAALIYGSARLRSQMEALPKVAPLTRGNVARLAAAESLVRCANPPKEDAVDRLLRPAGGGFSRNSDQLLHPGAERIPCASWADEHKNA